MAGMTSGRFGPGPTSWIIGGGLRGDSPPPSLLPSALSHGQKIGAEWKTGRLRAFWDTCGVVSSPAEADGGVGRGESRNRVAKGLQRVVAFLDFWLHWRNPEVRQRKDPRPRFIGLRLWAVIGTLWPMGADDASGGRAVEGSESQ